jgi:hypothetical protein
LNPRTRTRYSPVTGKLTAPVLFSSNAVMVTPRALPSTVPSGARISRTSPSAVDGAVGK